MKNRICKILKIEKPIIQGPFNWITNADLVGAVSKAGGLGVLGFNAGQETTVFTVEETKERMRKEIRKVREITNKPFGLNLAPSSKVDKDIFIQPMIDLMAEEKVPVAIMVGSLVPQAIKKCHEKGIKVVFRASTPTVDNTKEAILAGADIIVATGFDEGGTIPEKAIGTFSIVPLIVDAAEGKIPVMAAGGIADERGARAAFALGAEGLFVGTAFLASKESPLADNIKEMVVNANAGDLVMYRTIPAYYRSLPGMLPDKLVEMSKNGVSEDEIYKAQNAYIGMRDGMLFGDLTKGYASFGLGISFIHRIDSVEQIVDRLMQGINIF